MDTENRATVTTSTSAGLEYNALALLIDSKIEHVNAPEYRTSSRYHVEKSTLELTTWHQPNGPEGPERAVGVVFLQLDQGTMKTLDFLQKIMLAKSSSPEPAEACETPQLPQPIPSHILHQHHSPPSLLTPPQDQLFTPTGSASLKRVKTEAPGSPRGPVFNSQPPVKKKKAYKYPCPYPNCDSGGSRDTCDLKKHIRMRHKKDPIYCPYIDCSDQVMNNDTKQMCPKGAMYGEEKRHMKRCQEKYNWRVDNKEQVLRCPMFHQCGFESGTNILRHIDECMRQYKWPIKFPNMGETIRRNKAQ